MCSMKMCLTCVIVVVIFSYCDAESVLNWKTSDCTGILGTKCSFPFEYKGVNYFGCIRIPSTNSSDKRPKCAFSNLDEIEEEICNDNCPVALPTFTKHPEVVHFTEKLLVLECTAEGSPNPSIAWWKMKDGKERKLFKVPSNDVPVPEPSSAAVVINNDVESNAAYFCLAGNRQGQTKSKSFRFIYRESVISESQPKNLSTIYGSERHPEYSSLVVIFAAVALFVVGVIVGVTASICFIYVRDKNKQPWNLLNRSSSRSSTNDIGI